MIVGEVDFPRVPANKSPCSMLKSTIVNEGKMFILTRIFLLHCDDGDHVIFSFISIVIWLYDVINVPLLSPFSNDCCRVYKLVPLPLPLPLPLPAWK